MILGGFFEKWEIMYLVRCSAEKEGFLSHFFQPDVQEILRFIDSNDVVTLKEIKSNTDSRVNLTEIIETLINLQIIDRYHGRYTVIGSIISATEQSNVYEQGRRVLGPFLEDLNELMMIQKENIAPEAMTLAYLLAIEEVCSESFTEAAPLCLYERSSCSQGWFNLPTVMRKMALNKQSWVSFEPCGIREHQMSLGLYFSLLPQYETVSSNIFNEVFGLTGDVNASYFLNYVERKIRRLEKKRELPIIKEDIFMTALTKLGYLSIRDNTYYLNMTRIPLDVKEIMKKHLQLMALTFKKEIKLEQGFIFKIILLEWAKKEGYISDSNHTHYGIV